MKGKKSKAGKQAARPAKAVAVRRPRPALDPAECMERLRFETLLTELSAGFIHLPADQVDAAIVDAQRRVCDCLGLDLAVLWQWEYETPGTFTLTHYFRRGDGPPISSQLQASELWPLSLRQIQAGKSVVLCSTEDVPKGAERDQESFRLFWVKSLLLIPLSTGGGAPFGAISFSDMATSRTWSETLVKRLELVAQMFANTIARKRTELALLESAERLNLAAEAAGAGLWSLDLATGRYWTTDPAKEMFGFGPDEEVTLDRILEATLPEDRALIRQAIDQVVATGGQGRVEYRIVRPDGSVRWLASRGRMYREPGRPTYVMGVTMDVTEMKVAQDSVKQSEFRLATAIDVAGLGFYEVAHGENVTFLDSRAKALVGLSGDRALGIAALRFWMEHLAPEDRPRILDLHRKLNGGELDRITVEFRYLHPQRGPIWLQLLSHVVERDAAGHALWTIGVFRDITPQKSAEQEARRVQNELAHAMRVSTLGELAASMAHELNQPLAAILSNAQAARRFLAAPDPDMGEIREILDDIVKDDKRAGEVIHHVRAMLQKQGQVSTEPLDLNELVRNTSHLVHSELIGRNIDLVLDLSPALPAIPANRVEMQQVLLNLMVNAMDAMRDQPAARRQLRIETFAAGGGVRVAVRDRGPGIPEKTMADIFRPFFTTKTQGLGMGLVISRTMMEAHGGKLWAENAPDGGAIFWIEFPMQEEGARGERNSRGTGDEG
ncbi:MAG: PAS domain-containing protein [Kiritimatiellia bacterium]